jgi:trimethylamine-N-oxide reductase (cytochrome c)
LKEEQEKLTSNKEEKQFAEVSRRDFIVGAGTVVVGGAIGAGLLSGCGETVTTTVKETKTVPTTVTAPGTTVTETKTIAGEGGQVITVTETKTVDGNGGIYPVDEPEETKIHVLSQTANGFPGVFGSIDVKDGKIVRIRPTHYDVAYPDFQTWGFNSRGKRFETKNKTMPAPLNIAWKNKLYSPNRVRHPLKRIDWEPGGDPAKINAQNRGKSKFKRISWDEAYDIIYSEMTRIAETYGSEAILLRGGCHGENKTIHATHGMPGKLVECIYGGKYSEIIAGSCSWEGSHWGSKHVNGFEPFGLPPCDNQFSDLAKNCDMILNWPCDIECKAWMSTGMVPSLATGFLAEIGIEQVFICPDLNSTACIRADKWIPILPNTDVALSLAIAYIWIKDGTYDKDYVDTHVYGFDKFEEYVMGDEDGIAKTPEWAAPLCGVPEWTIIALAEHWASVTTAIMHLLGGGKTRGICSHEMMRMNDVLLGMQGMGKPGVRIVGSDSLVGHDESKSMAGGQHVSINTQLGYRGKNALLRGTRPNPMPAQHVHEGFFKDAITNPPVSWYGGGVCAALPTQWTKSTYPEEGCSRVHMMWGDCSGQIGSWYSGFNVIDAYHSNELEFILIQDIMLMQEMLYADVILPICTTLELDDINYMHADYLGIYLDQKCVEAIGESKSDYEALIPLAERFGVLEEYTGGKTVEEWQKHVYEISGAPDFVSWEELYEKKYWVQGDAPDYPDDMAPGGLNDFYNDPENYPLPTPSGKLEFYSQTLADHFPDDKERSPIPRWVPGGPASEGWTHDESLLGERAKKYPYLLVSNTPKWRVHSMMDDMPWTREINKVKGPDGYWYEPVWINPQDAEKLGIKYGDVVKIFNDRGAILGGARVVERSIPGSVVMDHGANADPITDRLDRGGTNNLINPQRTASKNANGMAVSGFLVGIEKANLSELREQYPEAFERANDPAQYEPAYGRKLGSWVEGGM